MKRILFYTAVMAMAVSFAFARPALAYDFGDHRSVTLTVKAWGALAQSDIEAVLAYTNKTIELYGAEAKKMQAGLTAYPTGTDAEIHSYWALNDVATGLFIQGEAYRKAAMKEEAKEAYQKVIDNYSYGQCWDPKGWFWKPAEAAKEKLAMIESGAEMDFSDNSSSALTTKAWEALGSKDLDAVIAYTDKVLSQYKDKAKEMQAGLKAYAWESKEQVFSYWALNDVGTCLYIKGKAYEDAGKAEEAKAAYKELIDDFKFAQCWDPGGWFWKPAEAAEQQVKGLVEQ